MLIMGQTLLAGAGDDCGCGTGWLGVMRACDDDDDDGGVVVDAVNGVCDVSTGVSARWDAVDDDGDDDFAVWSAFVFFMGGGSSAS